MFVRKELVSTGADRVSRASGHPARLPGLDAAIQSQYWLIITQTVQEGLHPIQELVEAADALRSGVPVKVRKDGTQPAESRKSRLRTFRSTLQGASVWLQEGSR